MGTKQEKNSLKNIVERNPWTFLISTIILTVGVTSAVFMFERNNLVMYNNLIIEQYKLENQRLEKLIDQQDKIKNLDSIANSLRNILISQTKIEESKHNNQLPINLKQTTQKWNISINKALNTGEALLKADPTENKTFESFNIWRNDCIALLNQVDSKLSTNLKDSFSTLTKLDRSDYPKFNQTVQDGLTVIRTLKNY